MTPSIKFFRTCLHPALAYSYKELLQRNPLLHQRVWQDRLRSIIKILPVDYSKDGSHFYCGFRFMALDHSFSRPIIPCCASIHDLKILYPELSEKLHHIPAGMVSREYMGAFLTGVDAWDLKGYLTPSSPRDPYRPPVQKHGCYLQAHARFFKGARAC